MPIVTHNIHRSTVGWTFFPKIKIKKMKFLLRSFWYWLGVTSWWGTRLVLRRTVQRCIGGESMATCVNLIYSEIKASLQRQKAGTPTTRTFVKLVKLHTWYILCWVSNIKFIFFAEFPGSNSYSLLSFQDQIHILCWVSRIKFMFFAEFPESNACANFFFKQYEHKFDLNRDILFIINTNLNLSTCTYVSSAVVLTSGHQTQKPYGSAFNVLPLSYPQTLVRKIF